MKVLKLISSVAIGVLILLVSILSFLGKVEESTVKEKEKENEKD